MTVGGRCKQSFSGTVLARLPLASLSARLAMVMAALLLAILVLSLGACGSQPVPAPVERRDGHGPVPAGYYRVLRGDTLMAISRRTGHSLTELAAWNGLQPPYPINAGSLLRVRPPGGRTTAATPAKTTPSATVFPQPPEQPAPIPAATPKTEATSKPSSRAGGQSPKTSGDTARVGGVTWQWPLNGPVVQRYEAGNRSRQGIRIQTSPGARVGAAARGTVVYSGSGLKGYGNLIIVKHNDHFLSVYGFNRRLLVKQGETVAAGQMLAEAGEAPGGENLLHFEIRRDGATVDPLSYLPKR
jgi:lipoprotein NlpD